MSEQNFEAASSARENDDEAVINPGSTGAKQITVPDISSLLDQIDSVLEKNSEEFVSGFVQKGGQ